MLITVMAVQRDSKKPMVETTEINYKVNKFGPDVVIQLSRRQEGVGLRKRSRKAGKDMAGGIQGLAGGFFS